MHADKMKKLLNRFEMCKSGIQYWHLDLWPDHNVESTFENFADFKAVIWNPWTTAWCDIQ